MTASIGAEPKRHRRSWRGLLLPAVLAFVTLLGLGTWQIQRKTWKEGLIATLTARIAEPPHALPAANLWQNLDPARNEFRRVKFSAEFENDKEALVFAAATGRIPLRDPPRDAIEIGATASDCLARAVARGVYEATALPFSGALPAWRDKFGALRP